MYLKIPNEFLIRKYKATAFGNGVVRFDTEHYVFRAPIPDAEDGYTFTATSGFGRWGKIQKLGTWYNVPILYDNLPITIRRTENREEKKRYKQYAVTLNELSKMFGNDRVYAVAHLLQYVNDNTRYASEVREEIYAVGIVEGCWFMSSECAERRRINSHGVKILGYISAADVDDVNADIKKHEQKKTDTYCRISKIHSQQCDIDCIIQIANKIEIPETESIIKIALDATASLESQACLLQAELKRIKTQFDSSISKRFTKQPDCTNDKKNDEAM